MRGEGAKCVATATCAAPCYSPWSQPHVRIGHGVLLTNLGSATAPLLQPPTPLQPLESTPCKQRAWGATNKPWLCYSPPTRESVQVPGPPARTPTVTADTVQLEGRGQQPEPAAVGLGADVDQDAAVMVPGGMGGGGGVGWGGRGIFTCTGGERGGKSTLSSLSTLVIQHSVLSAKQSAVRSLIHNSSL